MDEFDEPKPRSLSSTLFAYAIGGEDGTAGIARVSGDAGGFDHLTNPLPREEVRAEIVACLEQEMFAPSDDVQRLQAQCQSDDVVDEIVEAHRESFLARSAANDDAA